jgi:two-component system, OmpR family, sensor kinase
VSDTSPVAASGTERLSLVRRLWASNLPEAAWIVFALGNLCWMILAPGWAMLPYHLTWVSLLLLYGLGIRSWSGILMWFLVTPVMVATGLLLIDPAVGKHEYDELIELPMMVILLLVMTRLTNNRKSAIAKLDAVSRHNAALLEQQREFVQNASHELRTPITVALAHSELAQKAALPENASDMAVVVDELERLRRLVDRLLTLATAHDAEFDQKTPISLAGLLEGTLRRWDAVPRLWSLSILDDVRVRVDEQRMAAAVDALVENAVQFTNEGDRIELSVERTGTDAVLTVADSGSGIPEDQRGVVFERFRRGCVSAPGQGAPIDVGNVGLGLSIVRAITEANGGRVEAGSSHLGGAAVSIHMPLHDEVSERPGQHPELVVNLETLWTAPA